MYSTEIENGIALLDGYRLPGLPAPIPGWWVNRLNLDELDMSLYNQCVLGQLYGNYRDALEELQLTDDGAQACGFLLPWPAGRHEWRQLRHEWVAAITEIRQRAAHPSD